MGRREVGDDFFQRNYLIFFLGTSRGGLTPKTSVTSIVFKNYQNIYWKDGGKNVQSIRPLNFLFRLNGWNITKYQSSLTSDIL